MLRSLDHLPGVPRTMNERTRLAIVMAPAAALLVFLALRSDGLGSGDAALHFLIARESWSRPELFLDVWGRPMFTISYAIPALLGLVAVRLFSVLVSLLTCYATYRVAVQWRLKWALAVIPLLVFQPWYLSLSYDGMTEPVFACLFACALWAYARERWTALALLVSLFSLARWEGIILMILWAAHLFAKHRPLSVLIFVPHFAWNLFTAIFFKDWIALLFPLDIFWRDAAFSFFKQRSLSNLWFYPAHYAPIVGPALFYLTPLAFLAKFRKRVLAYGSLGSMGLFYMLASWSMPAVRGAAIPMERYFSAIAPALALCGLDGLVLLLDRGLSSRWLAGFLALGGCGTVAASMVARRNGDMHMVLFLCAAGASLCLGAWLFRRSHASPSPTSDGWKMAFVCVVVLVSALYNMGVVKPLSPRTAYPAATAAATWLRQHAPEGGLVLISHPVFGLCVSASGPTGKPFWHEWMNTARIAALPQGGWVAWESSMSDKMFYQVPRSFLDSHPDFEIAATFGSGDGSFRLYRRRNGMHTISERFLRLTRRYWPDVRGDGWSTATPDASAPLR